LSNSIGSHGVSGWRRVHSSAPNFRHSVAAVRQVNRWLLLKFPEDAHSFSISRRSILSATELYPGLAFFMTKAKGKRHA
jgi:hypothetical protein